MFARDGRASKLTEDGQRLLDYARRIVKLNVETMAAFSDEALSGRVRLGVPDDYADRYLPEIMARFSRAYPGVELTVLCEPSVDLLERIDANEVDLAIVTNCESKRAAETFRRERLLWVTSNRHPTHLEERVPLALGRPSCIWRHTAIERLESIGRTYRLLYSSSNAGAVAAAVLAGLAVSVLPESGLRPGMRVLTSADGFPDLPSCRIGLVRNAHDCICARRCASRAHHLLARQSVGSAGGGVIFWFTSPRLRGEGNEAPQQISTALAPSTRTTSSGASSTCKPRWPPLSTMRAKASADCSMNTGTRFFCPNGEMPPT